jgi:hypothetical protein
MNVQETILSLTVGTALLFALPSHACGEGECEPPPEPPVVQPEPPKPPAVVPDSDDGEPTAVYVRQYWTGVCKWIDDGNILTHTAWGLERFEYRQRMAHQQCDEKLLREADTKGVKP